MRWFTFLLAAAALGSPGLATGADESRVTILRGSSAPPPPAAPVVVERQTVIVLPAYDQPYPSYVPLYGYGVPIRVRPVLQRHGMAPVTNTVPNGWPLLRTGR